MKRLLCIVGSMNAGGAETFLMKVYRKLDKNYYQMDFAIATQAIGFYDNEILDLGGKIYRISPKSEGIIKNFITIYKLVKSNNYQYVFRTSQNSLSALELLAAKLGGATKRVFRSSNTKITDSRIELILHKIFILLPRLFANVRFAPSTEAADFVFGKNCITKGNAFLINNGINLNEFVFSNDTRNSVRKEFGVQDKLVVGHVGRFYKQKNHNKLISIFFEIQKKRPDAVLMLVGEGELENDIKKQIYQLGIQDKVIFTGVRKDVNRLLTGMDVFVFPSLYEGMPNTVVEAQATGLPCLVSDTITREISITDLISFMRIENDSQLWAEDAISLAVKPNDRLIYNKLMKERGYDIEDCVKQFVDAVF